MMTVRDLMMGPSSSPDGKYWEPALPLPFYSLRTQLRDAWEVFRCRATAIRQTNRADIPKEQP